MPAKILLGDYARQCREIAKAVTKVGDSIKQDIARRLLRTLVVTTPVDTGRARTNWRVGINKAPRIYTYPRPLKPASPEAGMAEALMDGFNIIENSGGRGTIHIVNNAPYIGALDTGPRPAGRGSPQAPAGYIESAIANARETLRSHAKNASKQLTSVPVSSKIVTTTTVPTPVAITVKTSRSRRR